MISTYPIASEPRSVRPGGLRVGWRVVEWTGAALCIFLMTGAVLPLLVADAAGNIGPRERGLLRLLQLPVVGFAMWMFLRFPGPILLSMRRTLPLTALVVLAAVSAAWSIAPGLTLRRTVALLATMALAHFLAVRFTPRQVLVLFSSVIGPCLLLSLAAVAVTPGQAWMPDDLGLRGVYTHKNVLGWASALGVVLSLGLLADDDPRLRRGGGPLLAVAFLCLVLSNSSTGLLASATAVILMSFHAGLRRSGGATRAVVVLIGLQLGALVLLALSWLLVPFLENLGRDATLTGRVPLWALLDPLIAERPWLGYGYGAFWSDGNYHVLRIVKTLGWTPPHGHNGYRDLALSLGKAGVILLAFVLVSGSRAAARLHRAQPAEGWGWMNAAIGVMLVINLSETNFLAQNDVLWLLMATILASAGLRDGSSGSGGPIGPASQRNGYATQRWSQSDDGTRSRTDEGGPATGEPQAPSGTPSLPRE